MNSDRAHACAMLGGLRIKICMGVCVLYSSIACTCIALERIAWAVAVPVAADDDDPWLCDLGARPVDRRSAEGGALDAALFHLRKVGG